MENLQWMVPSQLSWPVMRSFAEAITGITCSTGALSSSPWLTCSQRLPGWKMKLLSRARTLANPFKQSTKWILNLELTLHHSSLQWPTQGPCQFPRRSLWLDGHSPTWPHSAGPLSVTRDPFHQQQCPQASPLLCPLWQLDRQLFLPLESTKVLQHPWSAPGSPHWTRVLIMRWEYDGKIQKIFKDKLNDRQLQQCGTSFWLFSFMERSKASQGVSCTVILRNHCFHHKSTKCLIIWILDSKHTHTKTYLTFSW